MASTTRKRSALANTVKYHPDDHEAIAAARADLAAQKLADWIERALAAAPPLSEPQPAEKLPLDQRLAVTPGFNPRRVQEWVRTCLAAAIVGAVIAETLILTIAYVSGGISAKDLPQATASLITPLVGIAGAVLGFYFGSHRPNGGPEA
jgi:hypothetical protein